MKRTIATAEHYVWGDGCDGWHFVKTPELGVIRERMPPGTREVRHYHVRARQLFYVLSGVATFELDGAFHELRSGEGIEVPPGAPHHIASAAGSENPSRTDGIATQRARS